jgi:ABC-2 type transport system permease protein
MSVWRATWLMVGKDLLAYRRDRAGLLLGFIVPLALVTVAGFIAKFAFGGAGGMPRVTLWVGDADQSPASGRFLMALRGVGMLQVRPRPEESAPTEAKLRRLVRDGEIHHLLVIEAGFADALKSLQVPQLTMVRDPDRGLEDRAIRIGVLEALLGFLGESLGADRAAALRDTLKGSGFSDGEIQELLDAAQAVEDSLKKPSSEANQPPSAPAEADSSSSKKEGLAEDQPRAARDIFGQILELVPIQNEDITKPGGLRKYPFHYAQAVSGVTVMMVMLGLMVCSTTLIYERDCGTLSRLMVMAVPRSSIFWGKYLFSAVVGLAQLTVFFVYGNFIFKIDAFRDPVTLIVLCVTWTAAANSLGMIVAVWARTTRQAETLSYILVLVMAGLGGCWIPTQIMELPPAAEFVTRCMLTKWAMAGFQGMFWDQLPWTHPKMLTALGIQWAFAVITSIAALAVFRRRYLTG